MPETERLWVSVMGCSEDPPGFAPEPVDAAGVEDLGVVEDAGDLVDTGGSTDRGVIPIRDTGPAMSDNALERIELKIAYLENANQELSDIVYRQQLDIEQLRAQLSVYQRQLEAWRSEQQDSVNPLDERPPHY